jgi:hypothetical protein
MKKGISTPTQVKASSENIHKWSKAKISPKVANATTQMLDAKPSMPSMN